MADKHVDEGQGRLKDRFPTAPAVASQSPDRVTHGARTHGRPLGRRV